MRRKALAEPLTAYQLTHSALFTLADGQTVTGWPPNWVISRGDTVIDLCAPADFLIKYESAEKRTLALDDADRIKLERTLGFGATETKQHLLTAVDRLARLTIGTIDLDFTPGQWETLAHRAEKRGIPVEALVRRIVDTITQAIWNGEA